jgi:hypothetical protein
MKRTGVLLVIVAWLAGTFLIVQHIRENRAEPRRRLEYQAKLRQFSDALKPGMTRREVDAYLRSKNDTFRYWCCLGGMGAADELVNLRKETEPLHCRQHIVDIALVFESAEPSSTMDARDSDKLASVRLWDRFQSCK